MKVSINWGQYFSNVDIKGIDHDKLKKMIGEQLGAIEDVTDWSERYKNIYIVKIINVSKHPNADKLNLCLIDDGGVVKGIPRNQEGLIQVVCGAPVVEPGMVVAWLSPGAVVPSTYDKDPFVLDTREIRGIPSPGMLGTPHELGMNDDTSGLLQIDLDDVGADLVKPGTPFDNLYGMDDFVIDCENKMFTHRPDCFGILGVAREIAGITNQAFISPSWYLQEPTFTKPSSELQIELFNEIPELAPRLMAVVIDGIKIGPSPLWLQAGLTRVGIRPINNVVDVTNFMMQLTGQPMHAFDYNKIKTQSNDQPTLGVRLAKDGEKISVLNGKDLVLTNQDIVLATDKSPADLAGIMGGAHTEIDKETTTILLTCATFDMYAIRRATMRHGVFTDAATRYTKGQSPLQNDRIIAYAMARIIELAGGTQASEVKDNFINKTQPKVFSVDADFINLRLGSGLSAPEMAQLLTNVEIGVQVNGQKLEITPPFWRTDLEIPEDIVEEVGRLYGYDKLPVNLPARIAKPVNRNANLDLNNKVRNLLTSAGSNELLTYSFVSGDLLDKSNQDRKQAYQLSNALSPQLQYYRLSLTPSLLDKVNSNIRAGYNELAIYEINKVHTKTIVGEDKLPVEMTNLSFVYSADDKTTESKYDGAAYFQARKYLELILSTFNIKDISLIPLSDYSLEHDYDKQLAAPFDPKRSAAIVGNDNWLWGIVGEFTSSIRSSLKLPAFTAGFELNIKMLSKLADENNYQVLSKFPHITQDITFKIPAEAPYIDLESICDAQMQKAAEIHNYRVSIAPVGIYQQPGSLVKNISIRVDIHHPDKTLTTSEATNFVDQVVASIESIAKVQRV